MNFLRGNPKISIRSERMLSLVILPALPFETRKMKKMSYDILKHCDIISFKEISVIPNLTPRVN